MSVITATHPAPRTGGIGRGILRSWRGRLAVLLVAAVVAGAGAIAWRARATPAPVTYRTQPVARGTVTQTVAVAGSLAAAPDQVRLFFASNGRLAQIPIHEGDAVAQGQTLATLDVTDLQSALKQAQVNLSSAQARYQQTAAGSTPEDIAIAKNDVDSAQQSYQSAQSTASSDVATAEQTLTKTRQDYAAAQTSFTLVTEGIKAEVADFTSAIGSVHAIVWTTIVDFKTKSTADITTAKTALGQVDAALVNADTYATGPLAEALTAWTSARDNVVSAWLAFDDALARGTDSSGAAGQFSSAELAYTLAAARLLTTLDPPTSAMSSGQAAVTSAQAAMGAATSLADPDLDVVRADLSGLQDGLAREADQSDTIKNDVSQATTELGTIADTVGGTYLTARHGLDAAKTSASQSIAAQETPSAPRSCPSRRRPRRPRRPTSSSPTRASSSRSSRSSRPSRTSTPPPCARRSPAPSYRSRTTSATSCPRPARRRSSCSIRPAPCSFRARWARRT